MSPPPLLPIATACLLLAAGCDADAPADAGMDAGFVFDAGLDAGFDAGPPGVDASFNRLDPGAPHALDDVLRLNHLQVEGTHNSYHLRPAEETIPDWDYSMAPLDVQLAEQGVRKVELDLHWDPATGRFRVYHLDLIDEQTTCETFLDCLVALRRFSDANPWHHPVFVQIEPKGSRQGRTVTELMASMEAEILAVLPEELLVTPNLVRGDATNLAEAIATEGWPTLGEVRGRFLFFLNCDRSWCVEYANEGAGLTDRLIFADAEPEDPWAAVRIINSPGPDVRAAVEAGFIVRTRAVSITEALSSDRATLQASLDAALESGAQIISADVPTARPDVPFHVEIPGGTPSRCNPITAPMECTSEAIEDPSR